VSAPRVELTVALRAGTERAMAGAVAAGAASRIAAGDATLWTGPSRLGWVDAPSVSRPLVGQVAALRRLRVAGLTRVVVAAAGGSGVATEALAAGIDGPGTRLTVLDTTDPAQVGEALAGDLEATVFAVSAPPGAGTGDIDLLWDTAHRSLRAAGLDAAAHTVVVAAPGSALADRARAEGATLVLGEPLVDGPWCALTAYGLVPAGLAGADPATLLADAVTARAGVAGDSTENPAVVLGALLAGSPVVALAGDPGTGLAEWAAQLVAGATGKEGRGPLPVVVEGPDAPGFAGTGPETLTVALTTSGDRADDAAVRVRGSTGGQVVLWQHAAAVAAHLLGVHPFDRPDATASEDAPPPGADGPHAVDGLVEVHAGPDVAAAGGSTVAGALRGLLAAVPPGGHLALHSYLDRVEDASTAVLRPELARRTGLPTVFGWAPRCLAGLGQHAKGGPAGGAVCQLTGAVTDLDAHPDGAASALADRQLARARGDAAALAARGRPVLRLHFLDRVAGLVTVARAIQELSTDSERWRR
jgi:hypothetical protein